MKKKRNMIWGIGIFLVLLAAGGLAYRAYASSRAAEATGTQTATVQRGTIASTLSSSGNVSAGQSATITWETSGKVAEVTPKLGDKVAADQALASLEPTSLSTEVIKARQELLTAQQTLDDLQNSTTQQAKALQAVEDAQQALDSLKQKAAEDSSAAQLALAQAEEALADAQRTRNAMNYPHSSDQLTVEKAQTDYLLAKQTYKEALQEYNKYAKKNLTNPDRVRAMDRLISARTVMDSKLGIYNWYILDYTENEIAQAEAELAVAQANLETAQANWERLKNGTTDGTIELAEATLADAQREYARVKGGPSEAEVAAAQADVAAAQAALEKATLKAPFAGTITSVSVRTGDLVKAGDAAFRIDDLEALTISLQISEVDLASLQAGQAAEIEFDAIADQTYHGEVTEIGMVATNSQGVVNYPVTVRITDADGRIRPGMTASVTVTLEEASDALLVPNKAIRSSAGQKTVTVLWEGQQIEVPVTVGLSNSTMSAVTSDQLREGDTVIIQGTTATTTSTNQNNFQERFEVGGPGGGPVVVPGGGGVFP